MQDILKNFKKNNHTLIKDINILNSKIDYTDKFDIFYILYSNLKNLSKSELIDIILQIADKDYSQAINICSKIIKYDIDDKINFFRANFFKIIDNEKLSINGRIHLIMDYFRILYTSIDANNSNKLVTNISIAVMSIDLVNYALDKLEPAQYDKISDYLDIKDDFSNTLNTIFSNNLDNSDKLKKNTCIQLILDYVIKNKEFDEEYQLFQMLFNATLFSNTKNQQYIKDIIVSLGYENHLNAFNAAVMLANKQKDEFNKFVEYTDFGEDIVLILNTLLYYENYTLFEKKLNEAVKNINNIQDAMYNIYLFSKDLYTEIMPDSKKFFHIIKEIMPYVYNDEVFAEEIVSDALTYAKKTNVFEEEKSKIYEYMKKQTNIEYYCNILLNEKEYDLLLNILSELTDKDDILTFAVFVKHNKELLPNYKELVNIIKKIDDKEVKLIFK